VNPGLGEEAGNVARTAIEGFKGQPSCLAAIILAGIFAVLTFYAFQRDADRRTKTTDLLLERCYPADRAGQSS
jgi:hypothetical protein